jgi:hypothetical protein
LRSQVLAYHHLSPLIAVLPISKERRKRLNYTYPFNL